MYDETAGQYYADFRGIVPDFDFCCLLREFGMPQKTALYWHSMRLVVHDKKRKFLSNISEGALCAAPFAEDLMRALPPQFTAIRSENIYFFIDLMASTVKPMPQEEGSAINGAASVGIVVQRIREADAPTLTNCFAKGLLYLLAKGVLKFK